MASASFFGGAAVIPPAGTAINGDWSFTAGTYLVRRGTLHLAPPSDFKSGGWSKGSPDSGWVEGNAARLSAVGVSGGVLKLTTDTTTTFWTGSTQDAGYVQRQLAFSPFAGRLCIVAVLDLAVVANANESIHLGAFVPGDLSDYMRIGVQYDGSAYVAASAAEATFQTSSALSGSAFTVALDFLNTLDGMVAQAWYLDSAADPPDMAAGGWTRLQTIATEFQLGELLTPALAAIGKGSNVEGECSYLGIYRVPLDNGIPAATWPGAAWERQLGWLSQQFPTSGPAASTVFAVPVGASVSVADLKAALTRAAAGDGITVRAARGSAPSGSYTTIAALSTIPGGTAADLYLDVKMTSAGNVGASLAPLAVPFS